MKIIEDELFFLDNLKIYYFMGCRFVLRVTLKILELKAAC